MKKLVFILLIINFLHQGFSQTTNPISTENQKLVQIASDMMTEAGLCALITNDSVGKINVRIMQPFTPEDDLTIWFGTNTHSRKVSDIKHNPAVVLYYPSPDASGYVVLNGKAYLISDPEMKERYWMESWKNFYDKNRSNYLLIKVIPESMEILNTKLGVNGDPVTWKVPEIQLK
jgi:general stress protein 26